MNLGQIVQNVQIPMLVGSNGLIHEPGHVPESYLKLRLCSLCQVSTAIAAHPFCALDLWLATLCLKVLIGVCFPFRRNHPPLFMPPVYLFDSTSSPLPFIRDLQHLRLSRLCVLKRDPILLLKRQVHMPTYQNSGPWFWNYDNLLECWYFGVN